jgi:hypothetical protein
MPLPAFFPLFARFGVLSPLLTALVPLFFMGCVPLSDAPAPRESAANATRPTQTHRLPGFDAKDAVDPVIDPGAATGLSGQACLHAKDHPGKQLQELQDILHQQILDQLLLQALHDKYLAKHLFTKGWNLPDSLKQAVLDCIRISDERFYNGKDMGELCVTVTGGLVDTGCDDLRVWKARRVPCLSMPKSHQEALKARALRDSLAAMLSRHEPSLKDADAKTLMSLLSDFSILKEAYDPSSSTYCASYKAEYTPMALKVFAGVRREQQAKPPPPPPPPTYRTQRFGLGLEHYPLGQAVPMFGDDVAVVKGPPDRLGRDTRVLGLNGLVEGHARIAALQPMTTPGDKGNKKDKETKLVSLDTLNVTDFAVQLHIEHNPPLPEKDQSVDFDLFSLRFSDYIRDPLRATLKLDQKGNLLIQYHYRLVSSDFYPLHWPRRVQVYRVERFGNTAKLHVNGQLVLTSPSPGRWLQYVSVYLAYPGRLQALDIEARLPLDPQVPKDTQQQPDTAQGPAPVTEPDATASPPPVTVPSTAPDAAPDTTPVTAPPPAASPAPRAQNATAPPPSGARPQTGQGDSHAQ